eukprot:TRINITY_DN3539_c1_g1_i3.p1 TRINITY_DN3539_c1_g1~~TRINITY_DN3539_c1_g1_i3.p1  ORF type:complete len:389 (+),score=33.37 TRINITY_DN3539_c1_g1_i3:62-1228(+)
MLLRRQRSNLIPEDVLAVCGGYLQLSDVLQSSLVCRSWARVMFSDVIWKGVAKRMFIQLPILKLTPCRKTLATNEQTIRSDLILHKQELLSHKIDLLTQKEVRQHHPYILHGLLTLAWITAVAFIGMLLMITEEKTDFTLNDAFQMLQASYAVMFASLLFNVIACTHWEPQPLAIRIQRHSRLISLSGVSLLIVILFFFITKFFQYNVTSAPEDRYPWVLCFTPILLMLAFWQGIAILAAFPTMIKWVRSPWVPSPIQFHVIITTIFPTGLGLSICSLAHYVETLQRTYLIFASAPFLFGTMSVTATFILDYFRNGHLFSDAMAGFSMACLSAFPIGFMVFEPRGLLLLPLLLFSSAFAISYVNNWVQKGERERTQRAFASKIERRRI